MKSNTVKILGVVVTILGFGLTLMQGWVDDKTIDEKIKTGIDDELTRRKSEEES